MGKQESKKQKSTMESNKEKQLAVEYFMESAEEIENRFNVDAKKGLSTEDVADRQKKYGFNELRGKKKESIFTKFLQQFKDFMIIVLIIAALVSGLLGAVTDSIIILVVVIANAIIGVSQEYRAEKSLEALKKMSSHKAKVLRNGKVEVVESRNLVPGDVVVLETGDYVPADLRLIDAVNLKIQEASLTGESVPAEKLTDKITEKVGLGDRANMAFLSGLVTYGRGKGVVVGTGMDTEVGKIAKIINETEKDEAPLQKKLNKLGKTLGIAALAICVVIFIIGISYGKDVFEMFMIAVSLAVAAIPEGLAAVSTIVLAIGVQRMVKKNAIVKKLPAVETLGSTTVICSDKTGTLTQNRMTVEKIFINDKLQDLKNETAENTEELKKLVYISMLCNDTKVAKDGKLTGDPTETALIDMGENLGYKMANLEEHKRIEEIPFDSERKLMTTVHEVGGKYYAFTKGGVDELLARCTACELNGEISKDLENYKKQITKVNSQMAQKALRVLAMAYKELNHAPTKEEMKNIENDLVFLGLVGMIDPPREEVKVAVEKCKTAGIKTVMITGDHKITAMAIARQLGILEKDEEAITGADLENMSDKDLTKNIRKYSVYARVSPEHKVRIVKAWQANGEIVAMTGDGVNDAPALKTADIGCAMGIVGTDVAKEAADVILTDDNFATIVAAVEEGRRIYDNILKVIQFLLSSNVGEIIVLFIAMLIAPWISSKFGIDINLITPLLAIHILWVNLVTDSLPALALAVDPPEKNIMKRKPLRQKSGVFTKGMTWRIVYQGFVIGMITLAAFLLGIRGEADVLVGQTMAFIVLALSELVHIYNIRNNKVSIFKAPIFDNKKLSWAIIGSAALLLAVVLIPSLRILFSIAELSMSRIIEVICLILAPVVIVEIFKALKINDF